MRTWTVSAFGRELFKIEVADKLTLDDVMRQMMAAEEISYEIDADEVDEDDVEDGYYEELADGMIPCESCGEMFDPDEVDDDTEARFNTMTERLVWDASQTYPEPPPELFE